MFRQLSFQNFKSWEDTGEIKLAPITGFFGTNSSGKSAILQFLLMLKQTMESSDRRQVLHTGDDKTYVNLGTFYDIAHNHTIPSTITFSLEWDFSETLAIFNPESPKEKLFFLNYLEFSSNIQLQKDKISVKELCYSFASNLQQISFNFIEKNCDLYQLKTKGYKTIESRKTISKILSNNNPIPVFTPPEKNYIFPYDIEYRFKNIGFLSEFVLAYEQAFQKIYYLLGVKIRL